MMKLFVLTSTQFLVNYLLYSNYCIFHLAIIHITDYIGKYMGILLNTSARFRLALLYSFIVVINSVFTVSLKSSMDVQSSDDRTLLLKYEIM